MQLLTCVREFNEIVNMDSHELEDWLKEEDSAGAGWKKADETGETIGHERFGLV